MNTTTLAMTGLAPATSRWRQAMLAMLLAMVWIAVLYRETATSMVSIWYRSDTFAHGFLVVPIVLWLVWRQRHAIAALTPVPMFAVWPLVAFAALLWLLGELAALNAVTQLALVAILVLSVPLLLGGRVTRVLMFPLGFLFFTVPIGEFLLPLFMQWTADFTVTALRLSGIPVYREGRNFVIPSGTWSVVEACSGVRYLIASLVVGTLYAYLNYQSRIRRVIFVLVSLLVPVLANWVRAYMIVMLGHLSDNKLATGVDHLIYGWIFFGIVIVVMFAVGALWAEPQLQPQPNAPVAGLEGQAPRGSPQSTWFALILLLSLTALPQWLVWAVDRDVRLEPAGMMGPLVLPNAKLAARSRAIDFKPAYHHPSTQSNAVYEHMGQDLGLYLALYQNQTRTHKLVSSDNGLVASADPHWALVSRGRSAVEIYGVPVWFRTHELRGANLVGPGPSRSIWVWQIYWVNGILTDSDYMAKAYSVFNRLTGRRDDSATIVVYMPKTAAGEGELALNSFLTTHYSDINALLRKAQSLQ